MTNEQQTKMGFCVVCNRNRNFVKTCSPKKDWVCGYCRFTTKIICEKEPKR